MNLLKSIVWIVLVVYSLIVILLYTFQTRMIFYPGFLARNFKYNLGAADEEVFFKTTDGKEINGLYFRSRSKDVILYFHGNAGNLSGWQFVAEDFSKLGYNFFIFDYRGYGKSSGELSEKGLYLDGEAAFNFLLDKGFSPENIIVYGRSIGTGIAVDVAARKKCKGLILEAPFSSLSRLANEKLPLFFPSLYLKYRFDNVGKINNVGCPVVFLHGSDDTLIPPSHSVRLFEKFTGKKKMIVVDRGSHNDLHAFRQYEDFLKEVLPSFFADPHASSAL